MRITTRRVFFWLFMGAIVALGHVPAGQCQDPWQYIQEKGPSKGLTTHNGKFLLASYFGVLTQSSDGKTWDRVANLPSPVSYSGRIQLISHKNKVYIPDIYSYLGTIYEWSGGNNFPLAFQSSSEIDFPNVTHAISWGDYLYAIFENGVVIRSNSDGHPMAWTQVADLSTNTEDHCLFLIHENNLYVVILDESGQATLFQTTNGTDWKNLLSAPFGPAYPGSGGDYFFDVASGPGAIYFSRGGGVLKVDTKQSPAVITNVFETSVAGTLVPMSVFGDVTLAGNAFYTLGNNQQWQISSPVSIQLLPNAWKAISTAEVGNTFLMLSNGGTLMSLQKGIIGVDHIAVPTSTVYTGQQNVPLFGLSFRVTKSEKIKLTVRCLSDNGDKAIKRLKLIPTENSASSSKSSFNVVELARHPIEQKAWVSEELEVFDGSQFYVAVDIADNPPAEAALLFSIPKEDISFSFNPAYSLTAPLVSNFIQSIEKSAQASDLDTTQEVVVFPQPARDEVRFYYNLTSAADVAVKIYDETGALVSEITDLGKPAGARQQTVYDARHTAPGMYFATISITESNGAKRFAKQKVFIKK